MKKKDTNINCKHFWHSMTFDTNRCLINSEDCMREDCILTEDRRLRKQFKESIFYSDMQTLDNRYKSDTNVLKILFGDFEPEVDEEIE